MAHPSPQPSPFQSAELPDGKSASPANGTDPGTPICKVCGDSSASCGVNFGCISCESCKAFFRRSVSSSGKAVARCPFAGHCRITRASRKACPACRLAQCVRAGMRAELVDAWKRTRSDAEEKTTRPQKRKKQHASPPHEGMQRTPKCAACKCSTMTAEQGTQTDEQGKDGPSFARNATAVDADDQTLLEELIRANCVMDAPLQVPQQQVLPFNLTLLDALRVSGWAMRRMVAMFKQLRAFCALPPPDQVALLRTRLVELLILRGAMAFDPESEVWRHAAVLSAGGTRQHAFALQLNVLPPTEQHYQQHRRFLLTFGEQWRTDRNVMLLMHAIVLFSEADALQQRVTVQAQRQRYCTLLRRYLHWKQLVVRQQRQPQQSMDVTIAFDHLMGKLDELGQLSASFQRIYLQLNQTELEPLLTELFSAAK